MKTLKTIGTIVIFILILLLTFRLIPSNREPKEEITTSIKQLQEEKEVLLKIIEEKEGKIEKLHQELARRKRESAKKKAEIHSFSDTEIVKELNRLGF